MPVPDGARRGRIARLLLRAVAWMVPGERRDEWSREWRAEVDEAARAQRGATRLALGAFRDALAVRRLTRGHGIHEQSEEGTMGAGLGIVTAGAAELRRAARSLLRAPAFSAAAVLTLAVGIGATAAIFTLIEAVLLRPLPYPDAERVVRVQHTMGERASTNPVARATYAIFEAQSRSFEAFGGYWSPTNYALAGDLQAERVRAVEATTGLLDVLGARPAAGRLFGEGDTGSGLSSDPRPGADCRVVLGHGLWQRRYGADPAAVGRRVEVEGVSCEVIGVMAAGVHLPRETIDLWIPYAVPDGIRLDDAFRMYILARLRPGVDRDAAQAEVQGLTRRLPETASFYSVYLDEYGLGSTVTPGRDDVVGDIEQALWIVLGAVIVVMLVAAANIATLFLVRTEGRKQDVAVRAALGARAGQLMGHFLGESLVVAGAAGALGLALAAGAVRMLVALAPPSIPRLDQLAVGGPTVLAAVALSLAVGLALGAYPWLRFGRSRGAGLHGVRGGGHGRGGVGSALVVAQVALALVLLSGSALLVRSFRHLRSVEPGFDPEGVLMADLSLPSARFPTGELVAGFQVDLLARIEALPGVRRAALGPSPLRPPGCNGLYVEGMALAEDEFPPCVPIAFVSPGYWDVLDIPIVEGRGLMPSDATAPPVGVVSANVAERLWPGGEPLRGGVHPSPQRGPPWFPIVGVSGAVRGGGPESQPTEILYLPLSSAFGTTRASTLLVATSPGAELSLAPALRALVGELDPDVPLTIVGTLEDQLSASMVRTSFTLFLLGIAALAALVLGVVGLYGVVAYRVTARQGEIGIRMAVGAGRGQVRRLVLSHSLRLVGLGAAIGLAASLALSGLLESLLFGVRPGDPATIALATATLLVTATLAAWIPAQRATRIDPVDALRGE